MLNNGAQIWFYTTIQIVQWVAFIRVQCFYLLVYIHCSRLQYIHSIGSTRCDLSFDAIMNSQAMSCLITSTSWYSVFWFRIILLIWCFIIFWPSFISPFLPLSPRIFPRFPSITLLANVWNIAGCVYPLKYTSVTLIIMRWCSTNTTVLLVVTICNCLY